MKKKWKKVVLIDAGIIIIVLIFILWGMKKNGVADMRKLFLELKEMGKAIVLASHNKEDIDVLCDSVYEMEMGVLNQIR